MKVRNSLKSLRAATATTVWSAARAGSTVINKVQRRFKARQLIPAWFRG